MNAKIHTPGDFPLFDEAEWRALAAASINAPDLSVLVSRSDDGLPVGPIYPAAAMLPILAPAKPWTIVARIDAGEGPAAASAARAAAEGGAGAAMLVLDRSAVARGRGMPEDGLAAFAALLRGGPAESLALAVDAGDATLGAVATLDAAGLSPSGFVFDPAATLAALGTSALRLDDALAAAVGAAGRLPDGTRAILADGRPWHDGGASEAEELSAVLAAFVAALRAADAAGIDLGTFAGRAGIALAADADQFMTIAKFRAARLLVARVLEASGVEGATPFIHGETAWRSLSRRDPHVNLIRATTAAFAAAVGGADTITVLPFGDIGDDAFGRRMAGNTQLVLRDEANLWRVADPGAGSGAVETLTTGLAGAAWDRFRTIEAAGGIIAAVRAGSIQAAIARTRETRLARVADRAIELVGVNAFAQGAATPAAGAAQSPPASPATDAAERAEPLVAVRLAEVFERPDAPSSAGGAPPS